MNFKEYATQLGASAEVIEWIDTVLAAKGKRTQLDQGEVEHIIDYLISDAAPKRLRRMSYAQAKRSCDDWMKSNIKHGRNIVETADDVKTIHDFGDGSRIVELLTANAYKREGFLMSHCLGGYNPETTKIYSYRDAKNYPHATFEVSKSGDKFLQIKGKGNGNISPKYIHPILDFLRSINFNIRPSEMKNLGYFHVPESAKELLALFVDKKGRGPKYTTLYGEDYICA